MFYEPRLSYSPLMNTVIFTNVFIIFTINITSTVSNCHVELIESQAGADGVGGRAFLFRKHGLLGQMNFLW